VQLINGYLSLPDCPKKVQAGVLAGLRSALHDLRCLGVQDVPANGLTPSKTERASAQHRVSLVYASAVPVDSQMNSGRKDRGFQQEFGRLILVGQYYGALRRAAVHGNRQKIFLMPLGGGVFNNSIEAIAGAISTAVELLVGEGVDVNELLDIRVLSFRGNPSERPVMVSNLQKLRKFKE